MQGRRNIRGDYKNIELYGLRKIIVRIVWRVERLNILNLFFLCFAHRAYQHNFSN